MVKIHPELVWPVLERLKGDENLYVKKSVANVPRNASGNHPQAVLRICRKWSSVRDSNTAWIIKDGLKKLRATHPAEVEAILA